MLIRRSPCFCRGFLFLWQNLRASLEAMPFSVILKFPLVAKLIDLVSQLTHICICPALGVLDKCGQSLGCGQKFLIVNIVVRTGVLLLRYKKRLRINGNFPGYEVEFCTAVGNVHISAQLNN